MSVKKIGNKDQETVSWLSSFLWHWQSSGAQTGDTAKAILQILEEESGKTGPCQFPDPQVLLQELETS